MFELEAGKVPSERRRQRAIDSLAIPLEAVAPPKPPLLADGETCRGVLSISLPAPGSNESSRRGCYASGELDKSYTAGIDGPDPTLLDAVQTSVIKFESKTLESPDLSDLSEYDPGFEIQSSDDQPADPPDPE